MARTEHLPIYKSCYDLCLWLEQVVYGFSRYHKYAIGAELRDRARYALTLVVRANARRDKRAALLELREEIETLKALLRLGHDVKAFPNFNSFDHGIGLATNIARQNEGWLKSQQHDSRRGPYGAGDVELRDRGPTGAGQNRRAMPQGPAAPSVP